MKTKIAWAFVLVSVLLGIAVPARADGIIIPDPPPCGIEPCPPRPCFGPLPCPPVPPITQLSIRYHHVQVSLQDQVAITRVDQVFYNPNDWQVEGTYLFPLPSDAAVSSFTLWVDGKPVEGKVLDAQEARRVYEEIVSSLRDPAILEYANRGAVQASIFPIPPRGERRIELEYSQALPSENGLVSYTYPLSTEKFSLEPVEDVSVSIQVSSSKTPIRAVYSPSHDVEINRESDERVTAVYRETNTRPDRDFSLYYSLGEEQAFHMLSYRDPTDPADPDGFFMLMLAPKPGAHSAVLPKDVILMLDRSGSMEGEKFVQARQALQYILAHLKPEDRFGVIAFSSGMDSYALSLRPAMEAQAASAWVDELSAEGSTDINRALLEAAAMVETDRPAYLIFLTDGLPTEGVVDSQKILDNFEESAPENLRLFAFGVGYDVDTYLLDSLAQEHHGASTYVQPGERLDEVLSAFYSKISTPVMTDLELDFGSAGVYDVFPSPLPDLFSGSQIIVTGRYRNPGVVDIRLTGVVNGQPRRFEFRDQALAFEPGAQDWSSSLPRLWATRKVGYLLNQVRLEGADQETIDQIVRLSIRYGIVTPYTSYLVTEDMPLGAEEQSRIAQEQFSQLQAQPTAAVSWLEAVQKASDQGAMAGAEAPAAAPQEVSSTMRIIGSHTFVNQDGVWVDTAHDPESMLTVKVPFLSSEYFSLTRERQELAAGFSLGPRVIAVSEGRSYEVVEAAEPASQADAKPAITPHTLTFPQILTGGQTATPQPTPTPLTTRQSPATPGSTEVTPMGCMGSLLMLVLLFPLGLRIRYRRLRGENYQ